jgi:hypothetical protein
MNVRHRRLQQEDRSSISRSDTADLRLRLRTHLRRRDLDREIAAGASVAGNPLRELRARQLTTRAERHAAAACFANILDAAVDCDADPATRVTLDHRAVLAARAEIAQLIERLRDDEAVEVRGVALARLLADDAAGLLFRPRLGHTFQQAIVDIICAL